MDYEIMMNILEGQKNDLEEQKNNVETTIDDCNNSLSSSMSHSEISKLYKKLEETTNQLKNGYEKSSTWFGNYLTDLTQLESSLASFSCDGIDSPEDFPDSFKDIFKKVLIPTLKENGDPDANKSLGTIGPTTLEGFKVVDGNIIDTSSPLGKGEKYNLSDEDLALLAYVAMREQGSVDGAKLELSLMANLYERNKDRYSSVKDYVLNSGWFALRSLNGYSYPGDDYYNAAKEVLNDGNRYLASNVVEHDCLSDLASVSPGSIYDTSSYIPGETVIHNVYGATYVFVGFAPNGGDPFGYKT